MPKFTTAAALVLLVSALLAGCGADRPAAGPSPTAGSDSERALKFAQCMREHGVDMPDPGAGNAVTGAGPAGGKPAESGVAIDLSAGQGDAFEACRTFLPNGGEPRKPTAAELEKMVRYAQCMREHGIDYPDPSTDGVQPAIGVPAGDDAALQRLEDATRACTDAG